VAKATANDTALVTIIHAQNEIGTLQPVAEIVRQVQSVGALIHTDAAQSIGKVVVDVNKLGVDLLSIAGHKLYAPKGTGALYVRRGVKLPPLLVGASQERGLRPGTENVAYIVALGEACRLASMTLEKASQQMAFAANHFFRTLQQNIPEIALVGHPTERLPNTLNVLFPGVRVVNFWNLVPMFSLRTGPPAMPTAKSIGDTAGTRHSPRKGAWYDATFARTIDHN
jgi:cysteine desulfurase